MHPGGNLVLSIPQNLEQRVAQGPRAGSDSNTLFDEKGANLPYAERSGANELYGMPADRVDPGVFSRTVRKLGRKTASAIASASL
jgi:hypothetical protein